jgi:hypothetical protein
LTAVFEVDRHLSRTRDREPNRPILANPQPFPPAIPGK